MKGNKTFLIKYEIRFKDGSGLTGKETKAKNCINGVHAQVELEKYLKKRYSNFDKLIVHSCKEDVISALFGDFLDNNYSDLMSQMFGGERK